MFASIRAPSVKLLSASPAPGLSCMRRRAGVFIFILCLALGWSIADTAHAVNTGFLSPATCADGQDSGVTWNNPTFAQINDGISATATVDGSITHYLGCGNYGFNIPSNGVINGITVRINRASNSTNNGGSRDSAVYLVKNGALSTALNGATTTMYPTTLTTADYGGSTNLWNASWTPVDINNANFGVAFKATKPSGSGSAQTISVDVIQVAIDYTLDTTPPTVISINRVGVSPTSATSVQWLVTFSENVTGVDASDFQLVNTGLPGPPVITDVSGSGSSYTVTASTGSGGVSGSLGLNLVDNNSIHDAAQNPLAASGGGADGSFTGQVYQYDPTAATQCYTDDFNRPNGDPGSDWVVGNEGGSFGNPLIVNQRLRLTDASASASTFATLQRLFPGAGNKIVVEFTQYSYNGSGADGVGVVLSDASQPLRAGAFGGSLGYAPKQTALGGDTTHEGFAGGWIGIGLDEFGNYSNPTEGRTGGSGQTPESVAIRGSGSGYTGYAYMTGTGSLSPGIDDPASTTAAPGYRYRITVDHSDSVHAWTSVERDTNDGSGYHFVVPVFDAKAASGQAAVPANWRLSYTGATGGSYNIHEIDSLKVCSVTQVQPTLHHIELDYDGTTCRTSTVTIKACANADCSVRYVSPVTVDLGRSPTTNSSWSADPVTFSGGETQVTLSKTNTGSVSISGTATSPTAPNATRCFSNGTEVSTCAINFVAACFGAVEAGTDPTTPIYTKLVNTAFTLRILAVRSGTFNSSVNGTVSVTLVNPDAASGNCNDTSAGLVASQDIAVNNGIGSATFTSPVAARNVKVRMISGTAPTCSLDNFAIRPIQLAMSSIPAMNPPNTIYAAGKNFNIVADASPTSGGYDGTPALDSTRISAVPAYVAGQLTGSFPQADGIKSQGTFQYQEVADSVTLAQYAVMDPDFTKVDQVSGTVNGVNHGATPDCVLDSTNLANSTSNTNTPSDPRYGCTLNSNIGSSGWSLGRFVPDHFVLSAPSILTRAELSCSPASNFTYIGEPIIAKFTLTAQNANNQTTTNYATASGRAKLDIGGTANPFGLGAVNNAAARTPFAACGATPAQPCLALTTPASGAFVNGSADISLPYAVYRDTTAPRGPYSVLDVGIAPVDSDGVKINTYDIDTVNVTAGTPNHAKLGRTDVRYGRLEMANAYGSELLKLPISIGAEYWSGNVFVPNTDDSCTAIAANNLALQNYKGGINSTNLPTGSIASGITLIGGQGKIVLNPPSPHPAKKGSADLCLDLGNDAACSATTPLNWPWLQGAWRGTAYIYDPFIRATFGIYRSGPIIYLREAY